MNIQKYKSFAKKFARKMPKNIYSFLEFLYFLARQTYYIWAYPEKIQTTSGYETYWRNKSKTRPISRREKLICNLITDNSSVLDIGCGDGGLLYYLADHRKNIYVSGIEASKEGIDFCKARINNLDIRQLDISKDRLDLRKKYDYICLIMVLEHIMNPEKVILEIKNKYKKAVIISIPNIGFIFSRLRFLFGKFPITFEDGRLGEHVRHWTKTDIKWWLRKFDYEIEKIIYMDGIPILNQIFPTLFCQAFLIVVK